MIVDSRHHREYLRISPPFWYDVPNDKEELVDWRDNKLDEIENKLQSLHRKDLETRFSHAHMQELRVCAMQKKIVIWVFDFKMRQ